MDASFLRPQGSRAPLTERDESEINKTDLHFDLDYYVAFVTFLSLVFYGFQMRAVPPNQGTRDERPVDVVWMCLMLVYGSVVQLGGTWMLTSNYLRKCRAMRVHPDETRLVLAWVVGVVVVVTFAVVYPVLFYAIK